MLWVMVAQEMDVGEKKHYILTLSGVSLWVIIKLKTWDQKRKDFHHCPTSFWTSFVSTLKFLFSNITRLFLENSLHGWTKDHYSTMCNLPNSATECSVTFFRPLFQVRHSRGRATWLWFSPVVTLMIMVIGIWQNSSCFPWPLRALHHVQSHFPLRC